MHSWIGKFMDAPGGMHRPAAPGIVAKQENDMRKRATEISAFLPIDAIESALSTGGMDITRTVDGLVGRKGIFVTRIGIGRPRKDETATGKMRAIVTVKTGLPQDLATFVEKPGVVGALNRYATLAALGVEEGVPTLTSRITLYEEENALNIQVPLLLAAALVSPQIVMGTIVRQLTGKGDERSEGSAWGGEDFALVRQFLSRISLCNAGKKGLTAEFGLGRDNVSAIAGDHNTALWRLVADQPHPEAGGGLLCYLEMPHRAGSEEALHVVLRKLNAMEMEPLDLPPHFGAWCPGNLGDNPAYVSFLPNSLHEVDGIAVNFSFWAFFRAQWAEAILPSLGLHLSS